MNRHATPKSRGLSIKPPNKCALESQKRTRKRSPYPTNTQGPCDEQHNREQKPPPLTIDAALLLRAHVVVAARGGSIDIEAFLAPARIRRTVRR